jgi:hypothetical protein
MDLRVRRLKLISIVKVFQGIIIIPQKSQRTAKIKIGILILRVQFD